MLGLIPGFLKLFKAIIGKLNNFDLNPSIHNKNKTRLKVRKDLKMQLKTVKQNIP